MVASLALALAGCSLTGEQPQEVTETTSGQIADDLIQASLRVADDLSSFPALTTVGCSQNLPSDDADLLAAAGSPTSTCGLGLFKADQLLRFSQELLGDWMRTVLFTEDDARDRTADAIAEISDTRIRISAAIGECDRTVEQTSRCVEGIEAFAAFIVTSALAATELRDAVDSARSSTQTSNEDGARPDSATDIPSTMPLAEAGALYLEAICPLNAALNVYREQWERDASESPAAEQPDESTRNAALDVTATALRARELLRFPVRPWPDAIESDVSLVVEALETDAAWYRSVGEARIWDEVPDFPEEAKDRTSSERIRAYLGLPSMGSCPD